MHALAACITTSMVYHAADSSFFVSSDMIYFLRGLRLLCRRFAGDDCNGNKEQYYLNYAQIHFASVAAFVAGWRSS